jgi:hypothetical protein
MSIFQRQAARTIPGIALLALASLALTPPAAGQTRFARTGRTEMSDPTDPDRAPVASIDRFSAGAGTLQVRSATNGLPGPDEPVDFDRGPFVTRGLAADGTPVRYYNFDVRDTEPASVYLLYREGERTPVPGQLDVVDAIPGEEGYNDFRRVVKVTVPVDYVANTVTSLEEVRAAGYPLESTSRLLNQPIVPAGSTARHRMGDGYAGLTRGWYRGQIVYYFTFAEAELELRGGAVPVSLIYVTFAVNPDRPGGGPPSGFRTEPRSGQTHNVIQSVPSDASYSPLWLVSVYDNAAFDRVADLPSALRAPVLATGVATVNCPVFSVGERA